jgi:osmoprotectant transport system ATP-binding protein
VSHPTETAAIELQAVTKQYPGASSPAVDELSLEVPAGELVVFVGPSGCGKTTTLRLVNRLEEPTSGTVLIDGEDVRATPVHELRRRIGYVIQQGGLFPHQTIAANIACVPKLLGWSRARIGERVDELVELMRLDPALLTRYPAELSGGQQQRVGVARALAVDPPLLLMDEPYSAVDPVVRGELRAELRDLHDRLGTTIVFVTHDIDEAIEVGDRIAVFRTGGHLAQYAVPTELLARPADDFVEQFLGADRTLRRLSLLPVSDAELLALDGHDGLDVRVGSGASMRSALDALLSSASERALVVDELGEPLGVLTVDAIAAIAAGEPDTRPVQHRPSRAAGAT